MGIFKKDAKEVFDKTEEPEKALIAELGEIGIEDLVSLDPNIIKAYKNERIAIDKKANSIIYQLKTPLDQKDGSRLTVMTIRQPLAGEVRKAYDKEGNRLEISYSLLSQVANVPLGVIDRLTQNDVGVLLLLVGLFQ